jgi:hypothetical protein
VGFAVINGGTHPVGSGVHPLACGRRANQDRANRSERLVVDPKIACRIARSNHRGQRTRFDDSVIAHVGRVAAAVPPYARATAWLHDLFELTSVNRARLRASGLTAVEDAALEVLTRRAGEPYHAYVGRIADASGTAGRLARAVKLADLDDHLGHSRIPPDAPPYAWARRCVLERIDGEPATAATG